MNKFRTIRDLPLSRKIQNRVIEDTYQKKGRNCLKIGQKAPRINKNNYLKNMLFNEAMKIPRKNLKPQEIKRGRSLLAFRQFIIPDEKNKLVSHKKNRY